HAGDHLALFGGAAAVEPGIDPVQPDFAAGGHKRFNAVGDVRHGGGRPPEPRGRSIESSAGIPLNRDHEERRREPLLDLEISVEPKPEILGPAKMDKGHREGGRDVAPQRAERYAPLAYLEEGADQRSVEESQHGVVEAVKADGRMVQVVSQTHDKPMA